MDSDDEAEVDKGSVWGAMEEVELEEEEEEEEGAQGGVAAGRGARK